MISNTHLSKFSRSKIKTHLDLYLIKNDKNMKKANIEKLMNNGLHMWTINSKQCLQHSKLLTTQKPKAHVQVRTRGYMTIT